MSDSTDRMAPDGKIWQCAACGKRAEDRYGLNGLRSPGWDESCMLNAVLVDRGESPTPPPSAGGDDG